MGRIRRGIWPAAAFAAALLIAPPAWACPLCDSATGERVRAGIFGPGFASDLLATLLPFPVLLAVVAWVRFGPPWARAGPGRP